MSDPGASALIDALLKSPEEVFKEYHPADVAAALSELDDDHFLTAINSISIEDEARVLAYLKAPRRRLALRKADLERAARALALLESDDAADILSELETSLAKKILAASKTDPNRVARLLLYEEDSAGGLMQTELFSALASYSVGDTIRAYAALEDVKRVHNVYIVDTRFRLVGVVPVNKLIGADRNAPIGSLSSPAEIIFARTEMDQEEVARLFKKYDLVAIPVLDEDMRLVGRILIDDALDAIEEEASEDILRIAGAPSVSPEDDSSPTWMVFYRAPWLSASLVSGFIVGALIIEFEETLRHTIALVAFIPLIMGISGNIGSQSSALVIRGVAMGEFDRRAAEIYLKREARIALLLAVVCALTVGIASAFWLDRFALGALVGISAFSSVLFAAAFGTLTPLFFRAIKIDPAIAGGPVVLAIVDIAAALIFFAIASGFGRFV